MDIQEATVRHIPDIINLWKDLMDYHKDLDLFFMRRKEGHINFKMHLMECIKSEEACVYIALEKGELLGYILGKIEKHPPVFETERYVEIYDMYVKKSFRRQKIGAQLVKHVVDHFKKKGIFRIEMKVASKNKTGILFWKQQGFEEYMKVMYYKQ